MQCNVRPAKYIGINKGLHYYDCMVRESHIYIRTVCDVREPVAVTDNTVSQAPVTMALKPESENNINIVTNLTTPTAALTVEHRFSNEHFQRFHHIELN